MIRKNIKTFVVVQLLLLIATTVWAGGLTEVDDRFTFLGGRNGFYYYGWSSDISSGEEVKMLWVKMLPVDLDGNFLVEQRGFTKNMIGECKEIDSILCRIGISKENDISVLKVEEQYYYDKSGTIIAHWIRPEWINQTGESAVKAIADECASFLVGYFTSRSNPTDFHIMIGDELCQSIPK